MKAIIHATRLNWQERYFQFFRQGFEAHGISVERSSLDKPQEGDIHVLFGPNYWKKCEQQYKNYLQVNRKFIGNVHDDVAISWNGFNGRGIFNVDGHWNPDRFQRALDRSPFKIHSWRDYNPDSFLLLGQADLGRNKNWSALSGWYRSARDHYDGAKAVFREHPLGNGHSLQQDVHRTGFSVSLNSTVAVETLMLGHPTSVMDEGSPVFAVCGHLWFGFEKEPNRMAMFEYLANCQYHFSEIQNGDFWQQLGNGPRGPRLCDVTV